MNYTLTMQGGQTMPLNCGPSDFFSVVQSSIDVEIRIPGEEAALFAQGDDRTLSGGRMFTRLEVRNPGTSPATVIIFAGTDRYHQQRQAIIEPKTRVQAYTGANANTIPAGAIVTISPVLGTGDIRRKAVVVSNEDANLNLQLCDENGDPFDVVFFQSSQIFPVSETVKVKNPNGTAVSWKAGEIFWTV